MLLGWHSMIESCGSLQEGETRSSYTCALPVYFHVMPWNNPCYPSTLPEAQTAGLPDLGL